MLLHRTWLQFLPQFIVFNLVLCSVHSESQISYLSRAQRPGLWLPEDHRVQKSWLERTARYVDDNPKDLHPEVAALKNLIENNTRIHLLASAMYDIPDNFSDPSGNPIIRNYTHMLQVMNHLLTVAPTWNEQQNQVGLVGLPMHALVDWPMGTFNGFGFFLDEQVNACLKRILNVWAKFLSSSASADVLNNSTSGWFGPTALEVLAATANVGGTDYSFHELFVSDPASENYDFTSWDGFFTREFNDDMRPVAAPDNDSVIANVCESLPFALAHNVKRRDEFWVKGQPYSVYDMLGGSELSERFVGGTVYQAYLSSLSYHRWHSPVKGKIVRTDKFDGTYYSEPLFDIFETHGAFPKAPRYAQGYLSVVAARAVIYIQTDNPEIGLVAVVQIGMSEVSSCDITVEEGQEVGKGDEIGMFHFGGSSWCILFGKDLEISGFPEPGERTENLPVRAQLAVVG